MEATGGAAAGPGWYPDPSGSATWRWWDGLRWTGQVSPPPQTAPPPDAGWPAVQPAGWPPAPSAWGGYGAGAAPPYPGSWPGAPAPSVQDRFSSETQASRWAERAFVALGAITALNAILVWPEGGWARSVVHQLSVQLSDNGVSTSFHQPLGLNVYTSLVGLLQIGIVVTLVIWQYPAAKTAQLLGLPAARSPGWGVAGWFVPVVNLWFPYQALRDCLPPDDARRSTVLRMWLNYLGAAAALAVAAGLSYARAPVAIAAALIAVGFGIGVAFNGVALVRAIAEAHRALVEPSRSDRPAAEPA